MNIYIARFFSVVPEGISYSPISPRDDRDFIFFFAFCGTAAVTPRISFLKPRNAARVASSRSPCVRLRFKNRARICCSGVKRSASALALRAASAFAPVSTRTARFATIDLRNA